MEVAMAYQRLSQVQPLVDLALQLPATVQGHDRPQGARDGGDQAELTVHPNGLCHKHSTERPSPGNGSHAGPPGALSIPPRAR
jgi:hypothetical protein